MYGLAVNSVQCSVLTRRSVVTRQRYCSVIDWIPCGVLSVSMTDLFDSWYKPDPSLSSFIYIHLPLYFTRHLAPIPQPPVCSLYLRVWLVFVTL